MVESGFTQANYFKGEYAINLQDRLRAMTHSRSFIWWDDEMSHDSYIVWNANEGKLERATYRPNTNSTTIITDFMWQAWRHGGTNWRKQWEYIMENDTQKTPSPFHLPGMQDIFHNICYMSQHSLTT